MLYPLCRILLYPQTCKWAKWIQPILLLDYKETSAAGAVTSCMVCCIHFAAFYYTHRPVNGQSGYSQFCFWTIKRPQQLVQLPAVWYVVSTLPHFIIPTDL